MTTPQRKVKKEREFENCADYSNRKNRNQKEEILMMKWEMELNTTFISLNLLHVSTFFPFFTILDVVFFAGLFSFLFPRCHLSSLFFIFFPIVQSILSTLPSLLSFILHSHRIVPLHSTQSSVSVHFRRSFSPSTLLFEWYQMWCSLMSFILS